jgi:hypothetical protein
MQFSCEIWRGAGLCLGREENMKNAWKRHVIFLFLA